MGPKIGRGKAYKEDEISYLVESVDRYLPYGQNMWDSLAEKLVGHQYDVALSDTRFFLQKKESIKAK